jgi:nucleoside-diphosphate-sugar epimerase
MKNIFVIGCGAIGTLVAKLWLAEHTEVKALARTPEAAARLSSLGIEPVMGDLDQSESLSHLPLGGCWIYYFAPPPPKGTTDPRVQHLISALVKMPSPPAGIIYISTSGVYGDHKGGWVNEDTTPAPATDRARRRLDAETRLRTFGKQAGVPVMILRVGGIYGPDRLPVKRLRQGLPVLSLQQSSYTNRIHADDLASACVAAADQGRADRIYNICDDAPSTMTDYFLAVADALGLPHPPEIDMDEARQTMSPAMLSYLTESRRMDNSRMHEELGIVLRYPDLDSGLSGIAADCISVNRP